MIDKIVFGTGPMPGIVKATAVGITSLGGVLIADGVINASTGPIIAGMVTVIGTAVVVVAGQLWGASNKAFAEREAIKSKIEAERAKAEIDRRTAEAAVEAEERAALLRDSQGREAELRAENRQLRERLEAEIRRQHERIIPPDPSTKAHG